MFVRGNSDTFNVKSLKNSRPQLRIPVLSPSMTDRQKVYTQTILWIEKPATFYVQNSNRQNIIGGDILKFTSKNRIFF